MTPDPYAELDPHMLLHSSEASQKPCSLHIEKKSPTKKKKKNSLLKPKKKKNLLAPQPSGREETDICVKYP
jgi:hypothetical protein